jgi:alkylation response protein AidB-like acyl-CoA dehydrogenase
MDFRPTDEQDLLRRSVREFAEGEIGPHVMEWDEAQHFPMDLLPKLASLGLMGIQFPEEYGGSAMSAVDYCICIEELARVDPLRMPLDRRTQQAWRRPHFHVRERRSEAEVSGPARDRTATRRVGLTEASSGSDAASM